MQDPVEPTDTNASEALASGGVALRERPDSNQDDTPARPVVTVQADAYHDPTREDMAVIERLAKKFGRGMERWRGWVHSRRWLSVLYRTVLAVFASLIILAGIAMLVLPGPGWLTIFLGLAILGSEFHWARRLLGWLRIRVKAWWHRYRTWRQHRHEAKEAKRAAKEAREQAEAVAAFHRDLGE